MSQRMARCCGLADCSLSDAIRGKLNGSGEDRCESWEQLEKNGEVTLEDDMCLADLSSRCVYQQAGWLVGQFV